MALTVISDAPHVPRCILRASEPGTAPPDPPSASHQQPAVTAENWDIVHWEKFRYEIVDALAPFPDALAAFIVVVQSFRARARAGMPADNKIGENGGPPLHVLG